MCYSGVCEYENHMGDCIRHLENEGKCPDYMTHEDDEEVENSESELTEAEWMCTFMCD